MPGTSPFRSFRSGGGILKSIADGNAKRLNKLLGRRSGGKFTNDDLSYSLLSAIRQGKEDIVASLLQAGADPNCEDEDGKTALFVLLESGSANPLILKELLKAGADPNYSTAVGVFPLHVAARRGFQVCVKHLLGRRADLNVQDPHGTTPLMYAARENNLSILRDLVYAGADINVANHGGETALHLACRHGLSDVAAELLDAGADANLRDAKGQTPLLVACKNNFAELIALLLEFSVDVNVPERDSGRTVLHWAVQTENAALVTALLGGDRRADPNVKDKNWETPFFTALKTGRPDILKALLAAGCRVTVTDRSFNTALHIAAKDGRTDFIPLLIKAGLNVDLKGAGGLTALMLAAFGGHVDTVDTLLQYDANTTLTDRNRASALVYAILATASDASVHTIVKMLIRANCNVSESAKLSSVVSMLKLQVGCGLVLEDRLYSPLEVAFVMGRAAVFMMLLRAGADVSSFRCDADATIRDFKGTQADLKSRWLLLRCLQRERHTIPALTTLCRRPVLDTYRHRLSELIAHHNLSEDLEDFLCFGDLDDVCDKYASSDSHGQSPSGDPGPISPKSPSAASSSPFSKLSKWRQTFSGTSSKSPTSPKTSLPQPSWENGDSNKKKLSTKIGIVLPQGRPSPASPASPATPGGSGGGLRRSGSINNSSSRPAKSRGRVVSPNDMLLSIDPRPMSPGQLSESSSATSHSSSGGTQHRRHHSASNGNLHHTPELVRAPATGTRTSSSSERQAVVRPRSRAGSSHDAPLPGRGGSASAHTTPKAERRRQGHSGVTPVKARSLSKDSLNSSDLLYGEDDDIWNTGEGPRMNYEDIENEYLSNLGSMAAEISRATDNLTQNFTNDFSPPAANTGSGGGGPARRVEPHFHPDSIEAYIDHFHKSPINPLQPYQSVRSSPSSGPGDYASLPRPSSARTNGHHPRTRTTSNSSTDSSRWQPRAAPRRVSAGSSYSQPGTPHGSAPGTPTTGRKKYDNVPSSGYGRPCPKHSNNNTRGLSAGSSSGYGTRSSTSSQHDSPGGFARMRNTVGYRSLRVPSKTSQLYADYDSPSQLSPPASHNDDVFERDSVLSDTFSDGADSTGSRSSKPVSKIPTFTGKMKPSPLKVPDHCRIPVIKPSDAADTPQKPAAATPGFTRSRSFRKW